MCLWFEYKTSICCKGDLLEGAKLILDIDIGNTNLKWMFKKSGCCVGRGVLGNNSADWGELLAQVTERVSRVRVSNVGGVRIAAVVKEKVQAEFGVEPEFAEASKLTAGVRSGYLAPDKLGVDRWMGVVAGWHLSKSSCLIVDAGSALTLDFVSAAGKHLGGYIVPGHEMMIRSLCDGAEGIQFDLAPCADIGIGRSTETAVLNGCMKLAVTLIERCILEGIEGMEPIVILTGGGAERLMQYLPDKVLLEPDLVFDGLELAMP